MELRRAAASAVRIMLVVTLGVLIGRASARYNVGPADQDVPGEVTIHPPFGDSFMCSQHPAGQLASLGDNLGSDCQVTRVRLFSRLYEGDGSRNEDWIGWDAPVAAPFDSTVEHVGRNDLTNEPGTLGKGRSTSITFRREDGVRVLYAHLQAVVVKEGDRVRAGQAVAHVGNNGQSLAPHVHIGAWHDDEPLQIRFDLEAMGRVQGFKE